MASAFETAVAELIAHWRYVAGATDLATKWRIELVGGYVLDLYFNETLGKYSYTLVKGGTRVLGWDNAPHHPNVANFPHHMHRSDGSLVPTELTGNPAKGTQVS